MYLNMLQDFKDSPFDKSQTCSIPMSSRKTKKVEIDWNSFVHQPEPQVNSDHADATKKHIRRVEKSFQKYVSFFFRLILSN